MLDFHSILRQLAASAPALSQARLVELRRETAVLPALCGLPRIIRSFV